MARAVLEIVLDSKGNIQAIKQAGKDLEVLEQSGKGSSSALEGLGRVAAFVGGAIGAIKSAQAAVEFVELGASVRAAESRLEAFAGGADAARGYMEAFNEATYGTVDQMAAMGSAAKLLQMGLVTNSDEMSRMAAMATRLGDQTMDAGDRINDWSLMLANQSVMRLDNFGISSGRVRARIDELLKSGQALARDEAFKLAVLEIGAESLEKLGDQSDSALVKIDKIKAAVAEAKQGFALLAVGALEGAGGVDEFAGRVRNLPAALEQVLVLQRAWTRAQQEFLSGGLFRGAIDEFNSTLKQHAMSMIDVRTESEELRYAYTIQAQEVQNAEVATGKMGQALEALDERAKVHIESQSALEYAILSTIEAMEAEAAAAQKQLEVSQNLVLSKLDLAQALKNEGELEIAQAAVKELRSAYDSGRISFDQYATSVEETQIAFGLTNEAAAGMASRLVDMIDQMGSGTLAAEDFNERLAEGILIYETEVKQLDKFKETLASRNEVVAAATVETYMLDEQSRELAAGMDEGEQQTKRTKEALAQFEEQARWAQRQTGNLARDIRSLPDKKEIEIVVKYTTIGTRPSGVTQSVDVPAGAVAGVRSVPVGGFGMGGGGSVVYNQIYNTFGPGSVRSDADIAEITRAQERSATLRGVRIWEV